MVVRNLIYKLLIIFFVFQNALSSLFPIFASYYDEIVTVLFCLVAVSVQLLRKREIYKHTVLIILFITLILGIGLYSNLINDYQIFKYSLIDAFKVIQFILVFIAVKSLNSASSQEKSVLVGVDKILKIITVILFALLLLNYQLKVFPTYDERFNLQAQQLFFTHPTYLVSSCILIISLLSINLQKSKGNLIYIHILNLIILSTLRTKGILFVLIYYTILFFIKNKVKIRWYHILSISILVIYTGVSMMYDSLVYNPYYPRTIMMKYSFEIALDHFPFGTGFGTFGSYVSGEHYSKLYYLYGNIYQYYGLSPENYTAISDTYWPMLLAQFGFLGTIIFILTLIVLFKIFLGTLKHNKYAFFSIIILFLYLIITSTAESSFSNPYGTAYFFIIALLVNYKKVT